MNIKIFRETLEELQDKLCEILGVDKLKIIRKEIKEDAILDLINNQTHSHNHWCCNACTTHLCIPSLITAGYYIYTRGN